MKKKCQVPSLPQALQSPATASQGQAQPEASDKGLGVKETQRWSRLRKANTQMDSSEFWPGIQVNKPSIQRHQDARWWSSSSPGLLVSEMGKEQSNMSHLPKVIF